MKNRWKDIWNGRKESSQILKSPCADKERIFLELKRLDGFDVVGDGLSYNALEEQYRFTLSALCLRGGQRL